MDEPEEFFRKGGKQPKYTDPDKFSLEIHHGGKLIKGGGIDEYVGGEVVFLDHVDGDKMSWIELVRIVEQLGCERNELVMILITLSKIHNITATIQRDFGLEPSSQQIYRARKKACTLNKCDFVDQFHKLHDYCEELKKANPGSTVVLKTKMDGDQKRFHRLYICLDACKRGFIEGCRPLIGMDGAFIKGPHPGQLLAAVGSDGNNGMFPIAYAIVEIENKETWVWFIQHLIRDLRIENGHAYAFISDKQKGLSIAIAELIPNAEHRHCVRHFYNNFKGSHPGLTLKQILWDAARETTIPWWKCQMERMKMESEAAWKWLHPKPAQHWSRSHFKTHYKCDMLLNNLCEAFNSSIVKARDKPILQMLESIRTNLMVRMANRRVAAFKWKKSVGPRIEKIVEKNKVESGYCIPILSGDMKYQVTNMEGGQYAVDLGTRSCSCMRWDLCGIPCSHAIACISRRRQDPFDYVDECYKKAAYLNSSPGIPRGNKPENPGGNRLGIPGGTRPGIVGKVKGGGDSDTSASTITVHAAISSSENIA
ncbi:PREDICTED: uncharacterized protein LOC107880369 [Prunus mume]|uniref:Uncharacterized protein LOC107880369 n=1 Tax=Prunus mume TaxID=102107 RepID=A0ABM1LID3_PRUMU|nr:PREDICTED: uncharacterized protein LOC107880369 [Prunus mume]